MIDPITNTEYALVTAADFAHMRAMIDASGMIDVGFHVSDTYAAIDEALAELWNDPKMDDYDHYEELRPSKDNQ